MGEREKYVKGFNDGFLLRKHKPVLAKNITEGTKDTSDFVEGLKDGAKEYEKELDKKLAKHKDRNRSRDQGMAK